jgi:hypothetical protein
MVYYNLSGYNSDMFLVGIISWWYGDGWRRQVKVIKSRLISSIDFFSIELLASTLFAPYKQISAGSVNGPIAIQIRAFFDNLISRIIGAIVRTGMILIGLVVIFVQFLFGIVEMIFWSILPFLPAIGMIMMIIGWVPQ